ncbi:MAG: hypothetical protein GX804_05285, partial [Lentisphaerae bacterium]|nr:hypothetical protein [Lentisphaerota bacterium]
MVDFKKILKRLVFSTILLIAVLVLYASFLSPIPKFFTEGIPYTAYNAENQEAMMLVHGDHLQLMYHFKLAREMITGKIPLFYNLYEFNLGEDTGRRVVDPYYIPYSLVFSVASLLFGDAFGWNISQLLSVATGFFLLFLLARRLAAKDDPEAGIIAFCSAFIASCIPYLWVTLAGGSPTGFGMSLVPGVVLGIHMAVNDRKITGGFLAGIMLLLCYTTDLHCFFFAAITLPLWCAMFWCMSEGWPKNNIKQILRIFLALLPLVICGVIAVLLSDWLRSQYAATDVAGGRSLSSVAANSPSPASIINISIPGQFSQHFNIGIGIAAVLIVCALIMLVFLLYIIFSKYDRDLVSFGEWLTGLLIVLAVIFVIMLALGTNAPKNGLPIRVARKLIPPYSMIRQPVKIFCLLPTLMALSFAISFRYLRRRISHNGTLSACSILICILVLYASSRSTTAGVSLLPKSNTAYAAVVEEAAKTDTVPRAVAIPIWPGDSAWSSLYEFYSIQNGLRMINGYSPVKTSDYMENVFHKFETIAHGQLDDEQIAALQNFGVTAIILHENAFPEKVSPFPAGVALRNLLAHPRLKLLAQD